ncbi:MAG: hypothetical protein HY075_14195 [Deltaproteobacteria bacterium]|nr:hypothetical protein [Deltaproteobacteria bacterium]
MTKMRAAVLPLVVLGFAFLSAACTKSHRSGPPKENVLRMALDQKVRSFDPHVTSDVYSNQVQSLVYETLYTYHYLKRPLEVIPALAESLPVFSKDRKTMTIKLKKGIRFQDDACFKATNGKGRELSSADVVYMFERVSGTKIVSPTFGSLEHKIVGIDEFHAGKASSIVGISAPDASTVVIKLAEPQPRFTFNFLDMHTAIVPKECVAALGDEFPRHPVGTGPFHIVQADLSSKVVGVRNPDYHTVAYPTEGNPGDKEAGMLDDAGKQLPLVDKVVMEVLEEKQPQWLKFLAGDFEYLGIPKDNIGVALPGGKLSPEISKLGVKHFSQARGDVTTQFFNMDDPIWGKSKDLRHAFALAINRAEVIAVQYAGQAIQAQSLLDPIQYGYDPKFKSKWADRDVAKAKELLAKAGYPEGKGLPPLQMPTNNDTVARQFDELLSRQLKEVGITLKADPMTWPEFEKRGRTKNFQIMGMGFASGVPDFDDAANLIHSRYAAPGDNFASYRNAEVDKLVDEVGALDNGPVRLAKIHRIQELMDEDMAYVPMVHRVGNQLFQPWVRNPVYLDNMFVGMFARYLRVQTSK